MDQSNDYVLLGKISGVHGVKGWIKVFSYTSPRVKITEYSQWFIKNRGNSWKVNTLVEGRQQGKNIIALLEGINSREQAEALIGAEIAIHSDQLNALSKNEYFWRDLIGLTVETINGVKLGTIDWLFDTGSNDVIIVKDTLDEETGIEVKEHLIPFVFDDVIKSIDLDKSLMIVDWDPEF